MAVKRKTTKKAAKKTTKKRAVKKRAAKKATTEVKKTGDVHPMQQLERMDWPLPAYASAFVSITSADHFVGPLLLRMWPLAAESKSVVKVYGRGSEPEELEVEKFDDVFELLPPGGTARINGFFHLPNENDVDVILAFYFSNNSKPGAAYPLTLKKGWNPFTIPVSVKE